MANINRPSGSEKQNFKQIEADNWSGLYLPAICAGVVMTVVLFMAVSCSKKSDNSSAKINAPMAPAATSPAPVATTASTPPAPKKAIRKHRPANATYVNSTYGVSFSYPRKYSLQSGDKQNQMPVETGFTTPGAVQIASVDMPDGGFPDTDFSSALLSVSIKPGMTAEECSTFPGAARAADIATTASSDSDKSTIGAPKSTTIKLGANEYSEVEQMKGTGEHQSDLKYFHLFKNGGCYEFALDVETSRKADEELAQVDRGQVFKQLEKVLATAKIKEVELPGMENVEKTAPVPTDSKTEATEKAQVLTPVETPVEQK
jgi:hypothetical protein